MRTNVSRMFNFDPWLFIPFILLIGLGLLGIYTTGFNPQTGATHNFFLKQFIWFCFGIIIFFLAASLNYSNYFKYAEIIYAVNLLLLILTLVVGQTMRNTRGWISLLGVNFQFSEFIKISLIFLLAKYFSANVGRIGPLRDYVLPTVLVMVPLILVLIQPDLGTALVFVPIYVAILYISSLKNSTVLILLASGLSAVVLPLWMSWFQLMEPASTFWLYRLFLNAPALVFLFFTALFAVIVLSLLYIFTNRRIFLNVNIAAIVVSLTFFFSVVLFHFLKIYHKKRFLAFIDPEIDRLGAGYNIIQSTISIGSGELAGKGFLKGTQSLLGFLPAQNTDFIFSALAEQFGFVLTLLTFALFVVIFLKGINIVRTSKDMFGSLVATGIVTFLFVHLIVNIGMVTGFMPIIGLPLPFMSYGGSSLLTCMFSMAVLQNIQTNRFVNL